MVLFLFLVCVHEAEGGEVEDDMDAGAVPGGNEQSLEAWHSQCDDEQSLALLVGAVIASEMRQAVSTEARVSCSAGIAQNKVQARRTFPVPSSSYCPRVI